MTNPLLNARPGDTIEVRWQRDIWLPATIHRIYQMGADCVIGHRGLYYVALDDIRTPQPPAVPGYTSAGAQLLQSIMSRHGGEPIQEQRR